MARPIAQDSGFSPFSICCSERLAPASDFQTARCRNSLDVVIPLGDVIVILTHLQDHTLTGKFVGFPSFIGPREDAHGDER